MDSIFDKTTTNIEWLRDDVPELLIRAISSLRLALQKTPIYFNGNQRNKGSDLVSAAEIKIHFQGVTSKDRLDLFIKIILNNVTWFVVIEFDSARADQVAKKFVSRIAQVPNENLVYIAYCYPGTKSMSLSEVNKYFMYMKTISQGLNLGGFVGMTPPKNRGDL